MNKLIKIILLFGLFVSLLQAEEIKLVKMGGVYSVPVMINDSVRLNFIVDSGASSVSIPYDVFRTLARTGTIDDKDILGKESYQMANGDIVEGTKINIRKMKIGNKVISNISAIVDMGMDGHLLLGQSALKKIEPWYMDTNKNLIYIKEDIQNNKTAYQTKYNLTDTNSTQETHKQYDMKKLTLLCEQNDGIGCLELGGKYWYGKVVDQNKSTARKYYAKACDLNIANGCEVLAREYKTGSGLRYITDAFTKKYFINSCSNGIADGCFGLGSTYSDDMEYASANKYFLKSCSLGSARGCYELAINYREGYRTIEKNHSKANKYFKKSCDLGYRCEIIGTIFEGGHLIKKDYKKAIEYYKKSCALDEKQGCFHLANMYSTGKGVSQSHNKALNFYQKSCELNHARGCSAVGAQYAGGKGISKNDFKAKKFFEKGCNLDDGLGCSFLGTAYMKGKGVAKNALQAIQNYRKGCDLSDGGSCVLLGNIYLNKQKTTSEDYLKVKEYMSKGCKLGIAHGCSFVGYLYLQGKGVKQNYSKAKELFTKGCMGNSGSGCSGLGLLYSKDKDITNAKEFYKKACKLKDRIGCLEYKKLYE